MLKETGDLLRSQRIPFYLLLETLQNSQRTTSIVARQMQRCTRDLKAYRPAYRRMLRVENLFPAYRRNSGQPLCSLPLFTLATRRSHLSATFHSISDRSRDSENARSHSASALVHVEEVVHISVSSTISSKSLAKRRKEEILGALHDNAATMISSFASPSVL